MTDSPEEIAEKLIQARKDEQNAKLEVRMLVAALLWLRNHYDCDIRSDLELRIAVKKRIDDVLKKYDVCIKDMERARRSWRPDGSLTGSSQ